MWPSYWIGRKRKKHNILVVEEGKKMIMLHRAWQRAPYRAVNDRELHTDLLTRTSLVVFAGHGFVTSVIIWDQVACGGTQETEAIIQVMMWQVLVTVFNSRALTASWCEIMYPILRCLLFPFLMGSHFKIRCLPVLHTNICKTSHWLQCENAGLWNLTHNGLCLLMI